MSKIRVISNPLQSGRNGANTYYVTKGTQVVRPSRNNSNYGEGASRTAAQQARRIMWANPVNFFRVSAFWMKKAFESKAANMTDYNKFMSLNIGRSAIAFTKGEAASAPCVAESFVISQGSIPSVAHAVSEGSIISSILCSANLSFDSSVADICADILEHNKGLDKTYQISCIIYQQYIDFEEVPHLSCYAYELSLSDDRTDVKGTDVFPSELIRVQGGALALDMTSFSGGACFVLSSTSERGRLRVSTQKLNLNNGYLIGLYSSQEQYTKAAESYGIDREVFLALGEYRGTGGVPAVVETWEYGAAGSTRYDCGGVGMWLYHVQEANGFELYRKGTIPAGDYVADVYVMNAWPDTSIKVIKTSGTITNVGDEAHFKQDGLAEGQIEGWLVIVRVDVWVGGTCVRAMWTQPNL